MKNKVFKIFVVIVGSVVILTSGAQAVSKVKNKINETDTTPESSGSANVTISQSL